ncbi:MAG: hypothetical protein ACLFR7_05150 [Opitutales bacterium]
MHEDASPPSPPAKKEKPWPLSWVLIAVLLYALFQTAYFVFFAEG